MIITNIIYRYNPEKNSDGREIPAVPLRDLTAADVERMGEHAHAGVRESDLYTSVEQLAAEDSAHSATDDTKRDDTSEAIHAPAAVITAATRQRKTGPSEIKGDDSDATEL